MLEKDKQGNLLTPERRTLNEAMAQFERAPTKANMETLRKASRAWLHTMPGPHTKRR